MNTTRRQCRMRGLRTFTLKRIHKYLVVPLAVPLLGASILAAPARAPKITQVYTTAETSTSAEVIWTTSTGADSLLQYSTSNPVPASAPQIYMGSQVTAHQVQLAGLTPATVYFYKVTSCTRRGCASASGSFETFPGCPDVVPAISGSWQKSNTPNVSATINNQLLAVAAVADNDVWAVGWAQEPNAPPYVKRTLIQHFDGNTWNIVPSPNPRHDRDSRLHAVSGISANNIWAVGSTNDGRLPSRTLIQHWDGVQWTIAPSPSPDSQLNELRGVAALSASDVWAIGYSGGTETPLETFIAHWDGASWRQVTSPNIAGGANQLFSITAISPQDIWAVGSTGGAPLAMHWNGSEWSVVPMQVHSGLSTERLTGVSAASGNDVWAVGEGRGLFTNQLFATIKHWDGTRWTEKVCRAASSSNPPAGYEGGGPDAYFTGVSANAANDVWAVGVQGSGPMILHWDGRAWTTVTHPRAFPNAATLRAVAASKTGSAWSVGLEIEVAPSGSVSPERTLVNRYVP